ncbi:MAG: glycosyltransferase family 2 protein [Bacteroidota bacterium]
MSTISPEISVIMPAYNAEKYIAESIESVLNQTFKDFELLILDDASSDKTKEIVLSYAQKDNRIVYVEKQSNHGPATLRNEGISLAKGTFIALNDADDLSETTRFEKQISVFKSQPNVAVCGSWILNFGDNMESYVFEAPQNPIEIKLTFLSYDCLANSSAMFRKSCVENLEYQKEFVPAEDYKLWSEVIVNHDFFIIQEALVHYRQHENNISKTKADNLAISDLKIKTDLFLKIFALQDGDFDYKKLVHLFDVLGYRKKLSKSELLEFFEMTKKIIAINTEKNIFPQAMFQKTMEEVLNKPFVYSKTTQLVVFELKQKFPNEFKLLSTKSIFKKLIKF